MKHLLLLAALSGMVALGGNPADAAPITIGISVPTVQGGDKITLSVRGVLDPNDGIGAFTFNLSFIDSISYLGNSLQLGAILDNWLPVTGSGPGTFALSISDYPTDITTPDSSGASVQLFSIDLQTTTATPAGLTYVTIDPDPNDAGIFGAFQFTETSVGFSVVQPANGGGPAIPAPAGLAVVAPALFALGALRRRTRSFNNARLV